MRRMGAGIAFLVVLTASASASAAGNPSRGLELSQACQACHGPEGNLAVDENTPIIAGQHAGYLVHAPQADRSGDRQNAIMAGFASQLSDQDIRDLAAWYASQDGLTTPSLDK